MVILMELPHEVNNSQYNAGINYFAHNLYTRMILLAKRLEQSPESGRYNCEEADELSLFQGKPAGTPMSSKVLSDAYDVGMNIVEGQLDTPVKENLEFVLKNVKPILERSITSEL